MALPPQAANVRSIEAVDQFRTALAVYAGKAKPLVEDAWDEVSRTRDWLLTDRRMHWENEVRRRRQKLEEAEQALFSARFSPLRQVTAAEQVAVQRARRALAEAETKLANVKRWSQEFDDRAGPLLKQLEEVRTSVTSRMTKALGYLSHVAASLQAYAEPAAPPAPPPADTGTPAADSAESAPPIEGPEPQNRAST
jgi:chromosome segregation ATPase